MPLIWNNQLQAFEESEPPMTYNPVIEAWQDTEGYEHNSQLEAWEKVWPGQQHIYKDGQFVQGTYRWFKHAAANQRPAVRIIDADGYLRLNVTGTEAHGVIPVIVFSAPIPATARSIALKFKWGNNSRPYGLNLRAFNDYAENDINNYVARIYLTNANNTTDTLVCDISDVNTECYAVIDVWVGNFASDLFPGCTGENTMFDILELYYK